jgi:hypothetical protein
VAMAVVHPHDIPCPVVSEIAAARILADSPRFVQLDGSQMHLFNLQSLSQLVPGEPLVVQLVHLLFAVFDVGVDGLTDLGHWLR